MRELSILIIASIILIMSGHLIEYTIEGKKDIIPLQGKVDSIGQKNSEGFTVAGIDDQFFMFLKLKPPSIIFFIQIQVFITKFVTIQLYDKNDALIESQSKKISEKSNVELIQFQKSKSSRSITSRVKVILVNIEGLKDSILGLKYLLVKGEKVEPKNSKKDITKKPDSYFVDAKQSVHHPKFKSKQSGQLFSQRKKSKEPTEDEQLKRALEISKKQAQRQNESRYKVEEHKMKSQHFDYQEERKYPLVEFDKIKDSLVHVNSAWLEAQKKMEKQRGIKQQHRLSNHIQVRYFHGKSICIELPGDKKRNLQKMAEQMGAKIIKEVTDNCILIAHRVDTQKVARARKMKNVKILKPEFIEQCKQCDAYLNERDYFLKL